MLDLNIVVIVGHAHQLMPVRQEQDTTANGELGLNKMPKG